MPELGLIVWEQTEAYVNFLREAEEKRQELIRRWRGKYGATSSVGRLEPKMGEDCEAVIWIHDVGSHRFYNTMKRWSAGEALENALRYATYGYSTLSDLEQLIEGRGPLLEKSMEACGFRPHRRYPGKWARQTSADKDASFKEWQKKQREAEKKRWAVVSQAEQERLSQLWVALNVPVQLNQTYAITVNKQGLIYIRLEVNPFSASEIQQLSWFGAMLENRGHIAKEQDGFLIEARNIKLGKEKGIHIKAVRPDGSFVECVWPHFVGQDSLQTLTADLAMRMNGAPASS
jgi:hypothetical protein